MLDLVVVDGRARGIVTRDLVTGEIETARRRRGGAGHRRLRQRLLPLDQRQGLATPPRSGARTSAAPRFANPCFTQIHPTCIPRERRLPVEAHADERVAAERRPRLGAASRRATPAPPDQIPEAERDYYLERKYPSFGNLAPRDIASRAAKEVCDEGRGVGPGGLGVYLDFADAIKRLGADAIRERYGNLFEMYERITDENPYEVPMRIYPAVHYTMGGLWVDYNLMSTIPGLYVIGEANFSDHGANRLGASALMQGLADGYFVLPYTIGDYLGRREARARSTPTHPECRPVEAEVDGAHRSGCSTSRASGRWIRSTASWARSCGTTAAWRATRPGLQRGARDDSRRCARSSGATCNVPGQRRGAESGAGEGRPGGRLPGVRRADVPRRAAPRGVVRRPLPRGVPDRGRRGAARRRAVRLRGRLGVHRATTRRRGCTRSRSTFENVQLAQRSYK